MVGGERARRGAAVERLQHRRLHLDEPLGVEEPPDRAITCARVMNSVARLRVGDQVELAVAEARLDILRPWCFSGGGRSDFASRAKLVTLSESSPRRDMNAIPSTPIRSPRSKWTAAAPSPRPRARRREPGAGSAPNGRRGRGMPSCPGRGARPDARRRGGDLSVSSPARSPACAARTDAIGSTPANACGERLDRRRCEALATCDGDRPKRRGGGLVAHDPPATSRLRRSW